MSETVEITPESLEKLQAENREMVRKMAMNGQGVNPLEALATRIETFLDTFLADEDRLVFEYNFEYRMGKMVREALDMTNRMKLMQGVNSNSPDVKSLLQGK